METYFNVFKNIYIDLDALLDTRLGTLYYLDRNLYNYYLTDGSEYYKNRIIDEFEYIPSKVFKWYYKKRDINTLKHSKLTPVVFVVNIVIKDMLSKRILADKNIKKLNIDINIHPYKLDKNTKEIIKGIVLDKITHKEFVNVNIIDIDYERLDIRSCEGYGAMYMYNGIDWLNIRGLKKDIDINIPNTHLVLPYLLEKPVIFKENFIEKYFNSIEEIFKYYISLDFNRVELFSFIK